MSYKPQVNDYVFWKSHVHGWVYFKHEDYITIETDVWKKTKESYEHCPIHRNDRVLVLCYNYQWNELKYQGYRENKYSDIVIQKKDEFI